MIINSLALQVKPSDAAINTVSPLGFASRLMAVSPVHRHYPMSYLSTVVEPAVKHRQMKFYFNADGEPVAYVIWAVIAPDVERRFLKTGVWELHKSEWNEGGMPWIVDLVAHGGIVRDILLDLRDVVFRDYPAVRYYRVKNRKVISKEVGRDSHSYFMKAG